VLAPALRRQVNRQQKWYNRRVEAFVVKAVRQDHARELKDLLEIGKALVETLEKLVAAVNELSDTMRFAVSATRTAVV